MHVLDLFSGIGGLSLGLHWAGMRTVAFCEQDLHCQGVLRRHWPGLPVYDDVRTLTAARLRDDGVLSEGLGADLLCGGFPCQDVSVAGRGAGLEGARSGLWGHMVRLVAECGPRWVVVENVPGLRVRGADRVCGELEALGYAVWPLVVGAAHAGAPHARQRVWVVARALADPAGAGLAPRERGPADPAPERETLGLPVERRGGWPPEPGLRRVADGVPARLERLRLERLTLERLRRARVQALGNAVVPANAAMLGRAVLAAEAAYSAGAGAG